MAKSGRHAYKERVNPPGQKIDCLVVGGGVIGCTLALALRRRGYSVGVLERGIPGREASSAAAGILGAQSEASGPTPFFELAQRSLALYPAFVESVTREVGVDLDYRRNGALHVAYSEAEMAALVAASHWQVSRGLAVERWTAAMVRQREPALSSTAGAVFFPDDQQIDAERLAEALPRAAERAGARFVRAEARKIGVNLRGSAVEGVETDCGFFPAPHVVVAAGSWSSQLIGTQLPVAAVRPVRGQMAELQSDCVLTTVTFGAGGYLVPRAGGRLLVGSTLEEVGFNKQVTVAGIATLLERAVRLCPALAGAALVRSWAGLRPDTVDHLPLIGRVAGIEGLFLATGHYRNGILLAPVTAEMVAAQIAGEEAHQIESLSPARAG